MRVMAGVGHVYEWIINAQEPRKTVRNIFEWVSRECDFSKEFLEHNLMDAQWFSQNKGRKFPHLVCTQEN